MEFQPTPFTIPLVLSGLIAGVAAIAVWRGRDSKAESWGAAVQVSLALWALLHLPLLFSVSLTWKVFWFTLVLVNISVLVVTLLIFTLHYTGRGDALTRRRTALLLSFPVLVLAAGLTNGIHELVLADPGVVKADGYTQLTYAWGPAFYVIAVLEYAVALTYIGLLFQKFLHSRNVYRKISFTLFVTIAVLTGVSVVSATGLSPYPHFLLVPLAYLFLGGFMVLVTTSMKFVQALPVERALSVLSGRFGDLVPLARDFVVEEVDNGIVVLDTNYRVVDINSRAKKMIGVERAVGKHIEDIVDFDSILEGGDVVDALENTRGFGGLEGEVWVDTPGGERCYDVSASELTDQGGGATGYVLLLHDITKQKRREEKIMRREKELERQKKKLEHQNERLDEFTSVVSHDLRNPLNVAEGYVEMMRAEANGDTETIEVDVEDLERVSEAQERMGDIIEDALTLAHQGIAITETEQVRLSEAAKEAWSNVESLGSDLVVERDLTLDADRDRLLRVLENLFRNSVEHGSTEARSQSEYGEESLTVWVGSLEGGEGFYVEDDGEGIPGDMMDEVFKHGYTTSEDGTGLGLSIVNNIAKGHGWTTHVTQGRRGGARFEFRRVTTKTTA